MFTYFPPTLFQRPARYIGAETNACFKDPSSVAIRIALAFPDIYEIGESNLALKILYEILNRRSDICAERVYAPWKDKEVFLRKRSIPLRSLESKTPIHQFDFLGITLPSELCYTNILTILALSQIPLQAGERDLASPLVIGGGPGTANPEPLADFFDFFVLGDGEDVILEIMDRWLQVKGNVRDRQELVASFADIEGVYVPQLFEPEYHEDGRIKKIFPCNLKRPLVSRRLIHELDGAPYFKLQIVPHMSAIHDRIAIEIARGCTRGCRFCQAGMIYRPPRERSIPRIRELAYALACATGYEEISLLSLSSGDYGNLEELLKVLDQMDPGVGPMVFSLPSLRPDGLPADVLKQLRKGRKPGFTFAPEAGSDRLRRVINKGISDEEICAMAEQVFMAGWDMIKFYFMIGLPTETDQDLQGICQLLQEMNTIGRRILNKSPRFNITISPFVPKPHTPFQWASQESIRIIREKQALLKKSLTSRLIHLKCHTPEVSFIEAVLARGDRRLASVLENVWEMGARFDQWGEHFNFSLWLRAFEKTGIDPSFFAYRTCPLDEIFPWSHLSMGIDEGFLKSEYRKALVEEETSDCRKVGCHGCGACPSDIKSGVERIWKHGSQGAKGDEKNVALQAPISPLMRPELKIGPSRMRIRYQFEKTGPAIFISHLDLIRIITLAVRRAKIPVSYTQGFHPTPMISFGPALPLGMQGLAEYMDMDLTQESDPQNVLKSLNQQLPEGIHILKVIPIPMKGRSLISAINEAHYRIFLSQECVNAFGPMDRHEKAIRNLIQKKQIHCLREGKKDVKRVDIRPLIKEITFIQKVDGGELFFRLKMTPHLNARPVEVIEAVYGNGFKDWNGLIRMARVGLFIGMEDENQIQYDTGQRPHRIKDPISLFS